MVSADPAPGTEVPIETAVDLVVSGGRTAVPVPDVVNDSEQAAREVLEGAGFVVALAARLVDRRRRRDWARCSTSSPRPAPTTAPDRR